MNAYELIRDRACWLTGIVTFLTVCINTSREIGIQSPRLSLPQLSNPCCFNYKRSPQIFSPLLSSHRNFIPAMCWVEHTIRYYGCNATTPVRNFAGVEAHDISSTARRKCQHMRVMERLYEDYERGFLTNNAQNAQGMYDISQWAASVGYVLCQRSTYWASWRSDRHCMSDGLHGRSTCSRVGTLHTYPRAPGWPDSPETCV